MFVPPAIPPAVNAASIGIPDTMLLMLLALMVFGPRRLPEIGRQIGKLMYEFRKISNDFKFQMEEELRISEEVERQRQLSAATAQAPHTPPPAPDFTAPDFTTRDFAAPDFTNPDPANPDSANPAPANHDLTQPATSAALADPATIAPESAAVTADASAYPAASAEAAAPSFPSIQPPRQGGVVPRAFRGLVPQPAVAAEPLLSETAAPLAPAPELSQAMEQATQAPEHPQTADQHG